MNDDSKAAGNRFIVPDEGIVFEPPRETKLIYRPQLLPEYSGNPLIEALPEILSKEKAGRLMSVYPPKKEIEKTYPPEIRVHCIRRLKDLRHPLPEYIQIEQLVSVMSRRTYRHRNPLDPKTIWHIVQIAKGKLPEIQYPSVLRPSMGAMILANSGMGKSSVMEQVCSLTPQVIRHRKYKKYTFAHPQIVSLRLNCPHAGSLPALCEDFFREVDTLLGTDYLSQYMRGKRSDDYLIQGMRTIVANYFVGWIHIDDLQNLNLSKAGGEKKMLNFFRSLLDNVGTSMIFTGTFAAVNIFRNLMQESRRATDGGIIELRRPSNDSVSWEGFVNVLQQYQWLPKAGEFSDEIRKVLYFESQGITDFAVRLVLFAQEIAIREGRSELTKQLFQRAAKQNFSILQPALNALRSNKKEKMMKFDDLLPEGWRESLDAITERETSYKVQERQSEETPTTENESPSPTPPVESTAKVATDSPKPSPPDENPPRKTRSKPTGVPKASMPEGKSVTSDPYEEMKSEGLLADLHMDYGEVPPSMPAPSIFSGSPRKF